MEGASPYNEGAGSGVISREAGRLAAGKPSSVQEHIKENIIGDVSQKKEQILYIKKVEAC